jgi:hypothetical protein
MIENETKVQNFGKTRLRANLGGRIDPIWIWISLHDAKWEAQISVPWSSTILDDYLVLSSIRLKTAPKSFPQILVPFLVEQRTTVRRIIADRNRCQKNTIWSVCWPWIFATDPMLPGALLVFLPFGNQQIM